MSEETLIEPAVSEEPKQPSPEEIAALAAQAELEKKAAEVRASDVALLVGEYLKDKQELIEEDDSINISEGVIVRWGVKNIPCPSIEQLHALIQPVQQKVNQDKVNAEAIKFLAETDWLVIRELDNGTPCPAEIKAERQAARQRIVK